MAGFVWTALSLLFKIIAELGNVKPIIYNGRLISISLNWGKYVIHFKDSYQLLPSSLRSLAKAFNVLEKSIFPYYFVNISSSSCSALRTLLKRQATPHN